MWQFFLLKANRKKFKLKNKENIHIPDCSKIQMTDYFYGRQIERNSN